MNTRYAFIQFPNYCHQQTKITQSDSHLILVKERHRALYVSDLGDSEYALGIRLNMSLSEAKIIAPTIAYCIQDDDYFTQEFKNLAHTAIRFSPYVAIDDNYGLLINITGCSHLFGDENNMLIAIDDFFSQQGFSIQKSIAPNPMLAKALAYFANETIVNGNINEYIKKLPIDALFIEQKIIDLLRGLGIKNISDLLALPRKMLLKRFGIKLLQRIDQLSGNLESSHFYLEEKPQFLVREHFTSPLRTHDHFIHVIETLLNKAVKRLQEQNFSIRSIVIFHNDIFKRIHRIHLSSSRRNNDIKYWLDLLLLKIHDVDLSDGIDDIKLIINEFEQTKFLQYDLCNKNPDSDSFDLLRDKIKTKLGNKAIFHMRLTTHYLPEHAIKKDFILQQRSEETSKPTPLRPLKLFNNPIPISVIALLPDNPPAKILWKHHIINILHARGPERIEYAWWTNQPDSFRDYFYIEDERGKRLWIYATGDPKKWFIHGIFA